MVAHGREQRQGVDAGHALEQLEPAPGVALNALPLVRVQGALLLQHVQGHVCDAGVVQHHGHGEIRHVQCPVIQCGGHERRHNPALDGVLVHVRGMLLEFEQLHWHIGIVRGFLHQGADGVFKFFEVYVAALFCYLVEKAFRALFQALACFFGNDLFEIQAAEHIVAQARHLAPGLVLIVAGQVRLLFHNPVREPRNQVRGDERAFAAQHHGPVHGRDVPGQGFAYHDFDAFVFAFLRHGTASGPGSGRIIC